MTGQAASRTPLPVACSLEADDGRARLRRWQRLADTAAPVASVDDGRLEVHYRPVPGVQEELTELAAAEQTCCAFAQWQALTVDGHPVLRVTAPAGAPEAVAPIAALFGAEPRPAEAP